MFNRETRKWEWERFDEPKQVLKFVKVQIDRRNELESRWLEMLKATEKTGRKIDALTDTLHAFTKEITNLVDRKVLTPAEREMIWKVMEDVVGPLREA